MKLLKRGGILAAGVAVALVLSTCGGAEELFQTVEERVAEAGAGETYSVTYDGNGNDSGTVPVDDNMYAAGATVTVSGPGSLAKTGETFVGWNTEEAGGGTGYQGGNTFVMHANDVTLYAQWSENAYRLTLSAGVGGEISNPGTSTVNVDHGVPTNITATPDAGYTFDGWTVTEGIASIADETAATTTVTLEDGDATVNASFVDVTPPAAPDVSGGTSSPTNDTTPTWHWTSGGGGNGTFQYKLDSDDFSSGATTTSDTTYTVAAEDALSDGDHTLFVRERDEAGNWSDPGSRTVVVDTVGPNAPTDVSSSSAGIDSTPTWTWNSGGNGGAGTYRYKFNDTNLTTGATVVTGTSFTVALGDALGEGAHTLYVQERDQTGNWSSSGSGTFTVAIPPPGSVTAPPSGGESGGILPTIDWSSVAGASAYQIQVSDDGFATTVLDRIVTASSTSVDTSLDYETLYEWRVRTRNAEAIWGATWSTEWSFTAVYAVGDPGPAGGVIFWDDEEDATIDMRVVRYLEAASSDLDVAGDYAIPWEPPGSGVGDINGANSDFPPELTGIGDGGQNTYHIQNAVGTSHGTTYAAYQCHHLVQGGETNWYLPSKDTLALMYERRALIGGFQAAKYWSSTESGTIYAWMHDFGANNQSLYINTLDARVRPVRTF